MKIKIVGTGCPSCVALHELVKSIVKEKKYDVEVEYSTNFKELVDAGAMGSPGFFKDGKLLAVGMLSREQIINFIENE